MQLWMDGGARLGWLIDPPNRRVYVYRAGQAEPEVLEDPETLDGEDVLPASPLESGSTSSTCNRGGPFAHTRFVIARNEATWRYRSRRRPLSRRDCRASLE